MATLKELLAQREELERQIKDFEVANREEGLKKVREVMAEYGLTVSDLTMTAEAKQKSAGRKMGKVAAKYRNPETNETWSGRGLRPNWLKAALESGKTLDDFTI